MIDGAKASSFVWAKPGSLVNVSGNDLDNCYKRKFLLRLSILDQIWSKYQEILLVEPKLMETEFYSDLISNPPYPPSFNANELTKFSSKLRNTRGRGIN